jgi:hypothetical protein
MGQTQILIAFAEDFFMGSSSSGFIHASRKNTAPVHIGGLRPSIVAPSRFPSTRRDSEQQFSD